MKYSKFWKIFIFALILGLNFGCESYLDIVPDNTQEVELLFERKEQAYKALATCYSYLPKNDELYSTFALCTDELTTPIGHMTSAINLMRGKQSVNDPLLSYWTGYWGQVQQQSLYRAINDCNITIEGLTMVPDLSDDEKKSWIAEVKFLKAYYHFILVQNYGPIPIVDENLPVSASIEEIRVERNTVDECFDYISNTIDEAIVDLPDRMINSLYIGRLDKTIALSIKSRVLLYAASPLFNGNAEYYENFTNKDGTKLFPLNYENEKWKKAMDAAIEAIDMALENGAEIYRYSDALLADDTGLAQYQPVYSLYNYRFMFTDKWNNELLWGHSRPITSWYTVQAATMMKSPTATSNEAAWQWLSPTLRMAEMFYTKNGLPIDEDLQFDYDNRHSVVSVSSSNFLDALPGEKTAKMHLNREQRFYASIGFDRGYNRSYGLRNSLKMRKGETPGGRQGSSNDYVITGYLLKKYSHMYSQGDSYDNQIKYPWPIIRLAELYLNFAEAANEYGGPSNEIYQALNEVRSRVGLPNVEVVWADASKAKTVNKHTNKDGLREIIQQERSIELSFEGHRYNDVRRWKQGAQYFNNPVKGWSVDEIELDKFYEIKDVGIRSFITPRDYFHPIHNDEMTKNPNLVQNIGW